MYSFVRRCFGVLFSWAQLPLKWIWNLISKTDQNAFRVSLWIVICVIFCFVGMLVEVIVHRMEHPRRKARSAASSPPPSREPVPVIEKDVDVVSEEEASQILTYQASAPVSRPIAVPRPQSPSTPVFDEPSPSLQPSSSPYSYHRRGASQSGSEAKAYHGTLGGVQTIHTVEEMQREEPSRMSRLARRARNFITLNDGQEEPVYSRNVKWSDAFNASVYPDTSRQRKE